MVLFRDFPNNSTLGWCHITHTIHVRYIHLHLVVLKNVGKYSIHGSYGEWPLENSTANQSLNFLSRKPVRWLMSPPCQPFSTTREAKQRDLKVSWVDVMKVNSIGMTWYAQTLNGTGLPLPSKLSCDLCTCFKMSENLPIFSDASWGKLLQKSDGFYCWKWVKFF